MFEGTIGGALQAASRRYADRPALWVAGETWNYRRLFAAASGAAARLRKEGLEPGDRVAILARRSAAAYAGVLAALLAGGAYVPLNARYPAERNLAILHASGARALMVDAACAESLGLLLGEVPADVRVFGPDAQTPLLDSSDGVVRDGKASDLAYILFTSGTTGTPKGVPISHANLAAYLNAISRIFTIGAEDRVLQAADLTFDQSVHDLLYTWLNGAALYCLPENAAAMAPRTIAEHAITACQLVPSTAIQAGQRGLLEPGAMPSLRISLFGGEALPVGVARAWARAAPNSRVLNVYGPTEATVTFSTCEFDPGASYEIPIVPIGFPLRGGKMSVREPDGQPAAAGGLGEIYIAGPQLAAGYWRSPRLDAEKFVDLGAERWYRTGDLGSFDKTHGFIYAGRTDRQVKIRGYRVELQEIEGVLRSVLATDEVAVIAWPVTAEGVAEGCLAYTSGRGFDEEEALGRCRQILPPYMAPRKIIQIATLPLNANGKVDYRALTAHTAAQS